MYSQQQGQYPVMDNRYNNQLRNNNPPPLPPHSYAAYHPPNYVVPPEPAPNATDAQPTPILTIPEIADFASSMVFLMWHARRPSVMALHENSKSIQSLHTDDRHLGHSKETATIASKTSTAFKKFCKQVLSATQLSESVILLSLKYIAMLLQNNPTIQGADGSEYRLFTVALMLANKFLDDNTFTNKTWSEVSGMKVTDLNIMELEFLEVLRFKLFIRKDEFDRWKSALFTLKNQLEEAQKHEQQQQQQQQQQLLFDEALKGIVLPNIQQQQQQQQQNQQYQLLYMLSKSAQMPQFPTQPLNRPLTRVPLRIPVQPVWRHLQQQNQQQNPTTTTTTTQYDQTQQQQPQNVIRPTYTTPQQNTLDFTNYPTQQNTQQYSTTQQTTHYPTQQQQQSSQQYSTQQQYPTQQQSSQQQYPAQPNTQQYPAQQSSTDSLYQYNNPSSYVAQQRPQTTNYNQPTAYSQPSMNNYSQSNLVGTRLSNMNLTSQAQEFTTYTPTTTTTATNKPYYKDAYYNNTTSTPYQQQPTLRTRTSFYGEPQAAAAAAAENLDYSSYDMSGSQSTNDMYSRPAYQQQQQPFRQQASNNPPLYNNNNRPYTGPVPEDPLTAMDSYRTQQNQ